MEINFTKMHGLGNDFMMLDQTRESIALTPEQIRKLGDRHFGVGFDQLLMVLPAQEDGIDFEYRIFNVDGREVEHCGNGARCFARFVHDKGLTDHNPVRVKTVNRVLELHIKEDGQVTVDMGAPQSDPDQIPFHTDTPAPSYHRSINIGGGEQEVEFQTLSMGNPHAVIKVEDLDHAAVKDIGEALGSHADFPEGVNVGFMQVVGRDAIRLRVFERGTGETQACGTGACAAAVAGCLSGDLDDTVTVSLAGGTLTIEWRGGTEPVFMTGPVETVYEGVVEL